MATRVARIAVVGYGNIGQNCIAAIRAAEDMELAGLVVRHPLASAPAGVKTVINHIGELGRVDAALLALPSRSVPDKAEELLRAGIATVDSFDIHAEIPALQARLHAAALAGKAVSILSAGWDPGSDSALRALFEAMTPRGMTTTDFGPGMSMGHTVAVKAIPGVADALSVTLPTGGGIHRRMVYVQLKEGVNFQSVAAAVKADPYFAHDDTHVRQVEDVRAVTDAGHGVVLTRKGGASGMDNQNLRFEMRIHNPALTAQMMLSSARAALRQRPGCYTLIEIPLVDLLPGERDAWIKKLV